jgi:peptidoglycan/LPS O-acetylase OafA/YrhL
MSHRDSFADDRSSIRWLDGVRGLAAATVVVSHSKNMVDSRWHVGSDVMLFVQRLGMYSVVVFIFMSGYLLARPVVSNGFRLESIVGFYGRRARRILPTYYAALAFSVGIAVVCTSELSYEEIRAPSRALLGPLLLLEGSNFDFNAPLWSLPIEVHIYLVFPAYLALVRRSGPLLGTATWVLFFCMLQRVATVLRHEGLGFQLYAVFAMGALCAHGVARSEAVKQLRGTAVAAIWLVFLGIAALGRHDQGLHEDPRVPVLFGVLLTVTCAYLGSHEASWIRRWFESQPLLWLGGISYSLYLTHWPVLTLLRALLPVERMSPWAAWLFFAVFGLLAALAVAWPFAALFERPFLKHRATRESQPRAPALLR